MTRKQITDQITEYKRQQGNADLKIIALENRLEQLEKEESSMDQEWNNACSENIGFAAASRRFIFETAYNAGSKEATKTCQEKCQGLVDIVIKWLENKKCTKSTTKAEYDEINLFVDAIQNLDLEPEEKPDITGICSGYGLKDSPSVGKVTFNVAGLKGCVLGKKYKLTPIEDGE